MFQYPYGDSQQLNLDWLMEQWLETKASIDGSLQGEIDRVEAAITDLLTARDQAVAAQTAAEIAATSASGYAGTASTAASTATAQAAAAAASAALAGNHASNAQTSETNAGLQATAAGNSASAAAVSATNARNSELAAAVSSSAAAGNALYAEGFAVGEQNGNPVSSGSPYYENNAKYYAEQAAQDAQDAQDAAALIDMPATAGDIGKAIVVKTVADGKVSEYEFGEAGGGGGASAIVQTIENVTIASFDDGAANAQLKSIVLSEESNVTRTGRNILDTTTFIHNNYNIGGIYNNLKPNTKYVFSVNGNTTYRYRLYLSSDGTNANSTTVSLTDNYIPAGSYAVFTTPAEMTDNWLILAGSTNGGGNEAINTILPQIEVGDTYHDYEIYNGVEYSDLSQITTLEGYNNIWANSGSIILIEYYADSKNYIDSQDAIIKALIAKELPDMTADTALIANDFRIVNNTLYKVTAPVASGGTLTPGTNCTDTTITDVLKSLL